MVHRGDHAATDRPPYSHDSPSTRRAPGRPRTDFGRIIDTALDLVDQQGASALTLRALAARLGSSTAMLYRHLSGRDELVAQVVDRVFAEIDVEPDIIEKLGWSQASEKIALGLFDAMAQHRHVAELLVDTVPTGPNAMAFRELHIGVMLAAGFPPGLAMPFAATFGRYVLGFVMQIPGDEQKQQAYDAAVGELLRDADPQAFPATRRAARTRVGLVALREEFLTGLDLLLRGMRAVADESH